MNDSLAINDSSNELLFYIEDKRHDFVIYSTMQQFIINKIWLSFMMNKLLMTIALLLVIYRSYELRKSFFFYFYP